MAFNFNYNDNKEYELYGKMLHEEIELYGLTVRYFKTDRIGIDHIFGEHQSIKVNNEDVFEFNVRLGDDTGFVNPGDFFSKFGLSSQATLDLYVSSVSMEKIHPDLYAGKGYDDIMGNLVKLPNGKFMEITGFEDEVEGYNNQFAYADKKKIYKLTVRTYTENHDDVSGLVDEYEKIDLDKAFNIAEEAKQEQDIDAITTVEETPVDNDGDGIVDEVVTTTVKPVVQKSNPFGELG